VFRVDYFIRELCIWATDNPISAGAIAIVIVYAVFRSLAVRQGHGHAPT